MISQIILDAIFFVFSYSFFPKIIGNVIKDVV